MRRSHKLTASALVRVALLLGIAACGTFTEPTAHTPVVWLDVDPRSARLLVGTDREFTAVPRDAWNAPVRDQPVAWTSSDSTVVSVAPRTGLASARRAGRARVTVTSAGRSAVVEVVVIDPDLLVPLPAPSWPDELAR